MYTNKYCTINTYKRWLAGGLAGLVGWLTILTNWCNVKLKWVSIYYSIYVSENTYSFIDWMGKGEEREGVSTSDSGLLPINKPTLNIDILLWFCRFCSGSCHNDDACTFLTIFITRRCRCCCFSYSFSIFLRHPVRLLEVPMRPHQPKIDFNLRVYV